MAQHLFVYGSLGPGKPNEHILRAIGGTWVAASVLGFLKAQGWGAAMGFPGIVLDKNGEEIQGYIFSSDRLIDHWDQLDDFEGSEYQRVLTQVKTKDGTVVQAFIYILRDRG